jgi:hypothetical protein
MSYAIGNIQSPLGLIGNAASNQAFSFVPATSLSGVGTPVVAGEVACISGDCWVRILGTIQSVNGVPITSGPNAVLQATPFPGGVTQYTDGWIHLVAGMSLPFGSDPPSDTAPRDPVRQIDIWTTAGFATEVSIVGH